MLGSAYATNIAGFSPLGITGWRFAFRSVAAVAVLIGWLTLRFATDPTHGRSRDRHGKGLQDTLTEFLQVRTTWLPACLSVCWHDGSTARRPVCCSSGMAFVHRNAFARGEALLGSTQDQASAEAGKCTRHTISQLS